MVGGDLFITNLNIASLSTSWLLRKWSVVQKHTTLSTSVFEVLHGGVSFTCIYDQSTSVDIVLRGYDLADVACGLLVIQNRTTVRVLNTHAEILFAATRTDSNFSSMRRFFDEEVRRKFQTQELYAVDCLGEFQISDDARYQVDAYCIELVCADKGYECMVHKESVLLDRLLARTELLCIPMVRLRITRDCEETLYFYNNFGRIYYGKNMIYDSDTGVLLVLPSAVSADPIFSFKG